MNILVLGGTNDSNKILNKYTKNRCDYANKINNNYNIHFSGGFNKKFNKTDTSHAKICKEYFESISNFTNNKLHIHEKTNNTVEEALYFGNYFKNFNNKIIIITNDWHYKRVNYLFSKVFKFNKINNFEIVGLTSDNDISKLINEEKLKVEQLKNKPYGIWKEWLLYNNLS